MSITAGLIKLVKTLIVIFINYIRAFISIIFPPARKSIEGEIALITGAGHGIGREFALEISKLGAIVVLWDINQENNEKTANDVKKAGGKAYAYTCDITATANVAKAANKVREDVGEVTILVNNAGILNCGPLLDLSESDIRRTFEVNTLSHFWTIREFLPHMMKTKRGHILNVISMAGFSGAVMMTDYCASKHGALGFQKSLIEELHLGGYDNIRVTGLCPMFVDTGLVKDFEVGDTGRLLTPNEVALAGIDGMLRNYELVTVPAGMHLAVRIGHLFPLRTNHYLMRSSGIKINSHYKKQ